MIKHYLQFEDEAIEARSVIARIKDDLYSVRFELKAQKTLIEEMLNRLKEMEDAISK